MSVLPKFNFSESPIKTQQELEQSLDALNPGGKYFRPGRHEARVTGVEYKGTASDPNWGKFMLTLEGTGGKTIKTLVMVPFKSIDFIDKNGRPTKFLYQKFTNLMSGLGYPGLRVEDLQTVLPEVWTKPEKTVVGREVGIEVGYQGNHVRYDGKDEIGNKKYALEMADGSTLCDASGRVMYFNDYEAALGHAESNQIVIDRFTSVLSFVPSTKTSQASDSSW